MLNTHFWQHVLIEYGIINNWDMEEDLVEFFKNKSELLEIPYCTTSTGVSLTLGDVADAVKTGTSENIVAFFTELSTILPGFDELEDTSSMLVSMHSGSSDYLTVGDIRAILA